MSKRGIKGTTLPELLVAMIISGIVLMLVFDGMNMLQAALRQPNLSEFGTGLLKLQRHEILLEMTDSALVTDSVRYYKDGIVVETVEI